MLADKTGSLIATSAEFGAYFAGVPTTVTETLRRFGEQIGVAFQLSDDILDIASDSDESGKTPGTDLREGVADAAGALRAARRRPGRRPAARAGGQAAGRRRRARRGAGAAARVGCDGEARATLGGYADDARAMLTDLPDVPARAALAALCDLVIDRTG